MKKAISIKLENKAETQCPKCGEKSLVRYINGETEKPYSNTCGMCIYEQDCGYDSTPISYLKKKGIVGYQENLIKIELGEKVATVTTMDERYLKDSQKNLTKSNLFRYLIKHFGQKAVTKVMKLYGVGLSDHWSGSTVFWYRNIDNFLCNGKVIQYSKTTGKRIIRNGVSKIEQMDIILKKAGQVDSSNIYIFCLFGEHLMAGSKKPIALVESEKSALIGSICTDEYIWLATGNPHFIDKGNLKILKGREVILYPDNDSFNKCYQIISEYDYYMSTIVKDNCPEETADIADFILKKLV